MSLRVATVERATRETRVRVTLNLDGSGRAEIHTGIGFYDHMLHHVAHHGLFDLTVHAEGDLHIDAHHTAEDVAIALGQALDRALGERKGIVRMADAWVTMDEALAHVIVDLSGRPYCVFRGRFRSDRIGNLESTLIPHIFETLAVHARMNLHARVLYGRDDHHKAEALFKALGRALDVATRLDPRRADHVPSTKGVL
ncbi:MAG: imidazoleglycerol-phosphate dehydratase HisB [Anaerolineae bacterium]|nr:imidazoleglycerol-phosphate dehydratase HisB [Thermoflexales bacterium]MCX7939450.1 imidazoleglycerol-phosphate dehydratase HisB [Thermoflexales bacterium]MDW8054259.1 imidazoleglycerol-phosphate dehydratase HisB [Anaerolineae bacterium]MDW8292221.1 imidazoleglycerol-phosphate dehydratase HisB [Anaerolineae bacterium]